MCMVGNGVGEGRGKYTRFLWKKDSHGVEKLWKFDMIPDTPTGGAVQHKPKLAE